MTGVSHQQPLDRPLWVLLRPIRCEHPKRLASLFPSLAAAVSKQALSLCIENRLCAVHPVERTQQSFQHLFSQAKLPCDHVNVGGNVC